MNKIFDVLLDYTSRAWELLINYSNQTRVFINEACVGLEPWQVAAYTFGTTCVAVWIHSLLRSDQPLKQRMKKFFFHRLRKLPWVRDKIARELAKVRSDIEHSIHADDDGHEFYKFLPDKGLSDADLMQEVQAYSKLGKFNWKDGYVSGAVYSGDDELTKILGKVFDRYAWSNPLHPDVFPGVRKMEAEVVRMCCNMFNGSPDTCGTMTTGGTESILLACLAYRNRAYAYGIHEPEMIIPVTAHAAFDKAGELFRIQVHHIPVDPKTLRVDTRAMQRAINAKTCLLVGSAPNFPYGTVDPIEEISKLGIRYGIPVHVDACLGSFLLPFMQQAGYPLPPFDFRLEGVTSISCDTHKYGLTVKGSSVIMYRNIDFIHYQFFCQPDWPGGIYATPTLSGSRSGCNIAACWATMLYYGRKGYVEECRKVIRTAKFIEEGIRKIKSLEIMGKPEVSVVAFKSKEFNILSLNERMGKRGWNLNGLQFPSGVHIAVTKLITTEGVAEKFLADCEEIVNDLLLTPNQKAEGKAAIYGMAQTIPDRSLVNEFAFAYLDACYSTDPAPVHANGSL